MSTQIKDKELKDSSAGFRFASCLVLLAGLVFSLIGTISAQETMNKEILIKVKSGIVKMPGNKVSKVPISVARICSTDLRNLNKKYKAVTIERLYEIAGEAQVPIRVEDSGEPLSIKSFKGSEGESKKSESVQVVENVSMENIFTKEIMKDMQAQGKEVAVVKDTFLFQFEISAALNMDLIAAEYFGLAVVTYAEEITRKE